MIIKKNMENALDNIDFWPNFTFLFLQKYTKKFQDPTVLSTGVWVYKRMTTIPRTFVSGLGRGII